MLNSRAKSGVYAARMLSSWLVKWLFAGTSLERVMMICPYSALGYLAWGELHLDVFQELVHQSHLLREGTS